MVNEEGVRRCPTCRYDLEGLPETHRCPECGFEFDPSMLLLEAWGWRGRPTWYRSLNITLGVAIASGGLLYSIVYRQGPMALLCLVVLVTGLIAAWNWYSRLRLSLRGGTESALIVTDRGIEISNATNRNRRWNWDARRPPFLFVNDEGLHLELQPRSVWSWLMGTWPYKFLVRATAADASELRDQVEARYTRATGQPARRPSTDRDASRDRMPPGGFGQW